MYDDYEDDGVMDIIEEKERELKKRQREKAIARQKELEKQQQENKHTKGRGRASSKKKGRRDEDEDEDNYGTMSEDDQPTMSFGADSSRQRRGGRQADRSRYEEAISQEIEVDDAGDVQASESEAAKIEAAMKKAVASQKPKRSMPKMDIERLLSENGLNKLCDMAEKFKVDNEKSTSTQKLNQLMSLYELWSHVMYPSMAFSDVVSRLETLGHKRAVQHYLRKLRLGDNPGPWDIQVQNSDSENEPLPDMIAGNSNPLHEADDDNFDEFLSQALDNIEGISSGAGAKEASHQADDDEDLNDLDAFLDNLSKPVREELL